MQGSSAMVASCASTEDDERYEGFLVAIRRRFAATMQNANALFATDASGLFDTFLAGLPEHRRWHYRCNACRRFVERFGGLVTIDDEGMAIPAMWSAIDVPAFFRPAVTAMFRQVASANVVGVHVSDEKTWGLPSNKSQTAPYEWHHMSVVPADKLLYRSTKLKTADQRAAELLEDYRMLQRGLAEFPIDVVRQAHALLTSGNLYRSEKCIGVAKWLLDLHERREATKHYQKLRRDNATWSAVATAPTGFCHVRSSMIGTLLEDVQAGKSFDEIKRSFDSKMNPLQYQRPQAAPSAGNVAQAEKIVGELRSAGALDRRFAKLEDIRTLWKPTPTKEPEAKSGVFGHLKTKREQSKRPIDVSQPATTMTWEKFARTVLPDATAIEVFVPHRNANYAALVTASDPNAPPILQWDREDRRNPVGWYLYSGGSPAAQWNLKSGSYAKVTGIALQPTMWDPERSYDHQGKSVFFLLEGARDTGYRTGASFFPETLRSEFHSVRATMEAHARSSVISGRDEATACGIKLEAGATKSIWDVAIRVTNKVGQRISYMLDRWD